MNLNGLPELPSLEAAAALQNFLNTTGAASLGAGGAGIATVAPITDPGNGGTVNVENSGYLDLTHVSGAETRVFPEPTFIGQEIIVYLGVDLDSYGGNIAVTSPSFVVLADDTVNFDAVGQCVIYYAVQIGGVLRWRIERALNNVPTTSE